jgi:uncharacterized protein (DUF488 family)
LNQIISAGYSGFTARQFCESLSDAGVTLLVDSREIPLSRKPGFSKTKLANLLAEFGIDYKHYRELGSPSEARKVLHDGGTYREFFQTVRKHLRSADETLRIVADLAKNEKTCIMCLCPEVTKCHRSIVLEMLLKHHKFDIVELMKHGSKQAA